MGNLKWKPARVDDARVNRNFDDLANKLSELTDLVSAVALPKAPVVVRDYTILSESVIDYRGPGGSTIRLPSANDKGAGVSRTIYVLNNGSAPITVAAQARETVGGLASITVPQNSAATVTSNGRDSWGQVSGGGGSSDHKVKVHGADTTPDFLSAKLAAGSNISLTTVNPGANESVLISASSGALSDHKVSVANDDTTAKFLSEKLVAGAGITIDEINPGGDESLRIRATVTALDNKVKVTASDSLANYLFSKIITGPGISASVFHPGGVESVLLQSDNYRFLSVPGSYTWGVGITDVEYTGAGGDTISLPQATQKTILSVTNKGTGNVSVTPFAGDTLNTSTGTVLSPKSVALFLPNGVHNWMCIGGSFFADALTLSDSIVVGTTGFVGGRLTVNGDQIRMGTHTILVSPGFSVGPVEDSFLSGDLKEMQFGTSFASVVGNHIFGGGLVVKSDGGIYIASGSGPDGHSVPGGAIHVSAKSVDGGELILEAGNGGDNEGTVKIQPGVAFGDGLNRFFQIFDGVGAKQGPHLGAATDLASVITLANTMRVWLTAWGWFSAGGG